MKPFLLVLALLAAARVASADHSQGPDVPDVLKVPAGETLVLVAKARGVQTYVCRPKRDNSGQFEWAFIGPEADLFDDAGKPLGRHFAGPTWELLDGSSVVGTVRGSKPSPTAGAVPWLLLAAKAHGGAGGLSRVTSIQRLETSGGSAPAGGAGPNTLGQKVRVPYTATYYFYGPRPPS